jgi:replication factor A1
VKIAQKYNVDPINFVDAFLEAWRNKEDNYENLTVVCRVVKDDSATFLITNNEKVVSQFPIKIEALRNPVTLKNYVSSISISTKPKKEVQPKQRKIGQLRYGMKRVNLKADIVEVSSVKEVLTRYGNVSKVSNIKIADETGSIRLSLWNKHINNFVVGDKVEIKNCYVARYRGIIQINLGKKGEIHLIDQDETEKMK